MTPWKTWLAHALFAALVTLAFAQLLDPWMAALLAWWGYMWREMDQVLRKATRAWGRGLRWMELWQEWVRAVNWLDSLMDVVAPACSAALVAWWLIVRGL